MPTWNELLEEINDASKAHDVVRRQYLERLNKVTGRNVIVYYSGWLQKGLVAQQSGANLGINDADKNGFMAAIHQLDRSLGLDLILHTPGGSMSATESLIDYLRKMFGTNIRAIVPQLAMSGGTMMACACKEIIMGKHSSLGPIDPQIFGLPAHGIIEEFQRISTEITNDPSKIPLWQPILAKYQPTMVGEAQKVSQWALDMVRQWLDTGMFKGKRNRSARIDKVLDELGDHALTLSHDRHISLEKAREAGLVVIALEDDDALQDAVLSVHHACIHTLTRTDAVKIIENHNGTAYIQVVKMAVQAIQ